MSREEFEAALADACMGDRALEPSKSADTCRTLYAAAIERAEGVTHTCKEQAKLITQIDAERTALRAEVSRLRDLIVDPTGEIDALLAGVAALKEANRALVETAGGEIAALKAECDNWKSCAKTIEAERDALRAALESAMQWGIELGTADPEWVVEARAALAGEGK